MVASAACLEGFAGGSDALAADLLSALVQSPFFGACGPFRVKEAEVVAHVSKYREGV